MKVNKQCRIVLFKWTNILTVITFETGCSVVLGNAMFQKAKIDFPGARPAADPVSRCCLVAFCVLLVLFAVFICCLLFF